MKRCVAIAVALASLPLFGAGCIGRGISEGVGAITGAKGVVRVTSPLQGGAYPLAGYTRFRLEPFTDSTGGAVPEELKNALPGFFDGQLAKDKIPNSGDRVVILRGLYIYYEDSTKTLDQAFGPFEEVVTRVQLIDGASGKILGEANCVGRSTQSVNKGPKDKADGLSKALANWIKKNYPPT